MFEFINDIGTYESRRVDRYESGDLMISTAAVSDGKQPYETAVRHPRYNGGEMVIVEAYNTRIDAKTGHDKWVKLMTAKKLPPKLADCANAGIAQMLEAIGGNMEFPLSAMPKKPSAKRKVK